MITKLQGLKQVLAQARKMISWLEMDMAVDTTKMLENARDIEKALEAVIKEGEE